MTAHSLLPHNILWAMMGGLGGWGGRSNQADDGLDAFCLSEVRPVSWLNWDYVSEGEPRTEFKKSQDHVTFFVVPRSLQT